MPPPIVPQPGIVDTYDTSDALGSIRLASGESIRFGRSACSFDPVVGTRVVVEAAEIGRLGPRATRVSAEGPRALTQSERIVIIASWLLRPLECYSDFALARRLADPQTPKHAQARELVREELGLRGRSGEEIDEMIALMRWADEMLNPPDREVTTVIGDAHDVVFAIDAGERDGRLSADEAQHLRERLQRLG
jgi:hypothetical protein